MLFDFSPSKRKVHRGNGDSTSPPKIRSLNHSPRNKRVEHIRKEAKENKHQRYQQNSDDLESSF